MEYKMFVIPIYLYDEDEEEELERLEDLGIESGELPGSKQAPLRTLYIDTYFIDPDKNKRTRTRDIVFYINGTSFRTPFSQKIINEVIHPAMMVKAIWMQEKSNDGHPPVILSTN